MCTRHMHGAETRTRTYACMQFGNDMAVAATAAAVVSEEIITISRAERKWVRARNPNNFHTTIAHTEREHNNDVCTRGRKRRKHLIR